MHQGEFPNSRRVGTGDGRAELLGDEGHGLRHKDSTRHQPGPGEGWHPAGLRRPLASAAGPPRPVVRRADDASRSLRGKPRTRYSRSRQSRRRGDALGSPGGRMKTSTCDPSPEDTACRGRRVRRDPQLTGPGLDEFEELACVLRGGKVDSYSRVMTAEAADQGGRWIGGEGRQAGQREDARTRGPRRPVTAARPVSRSRST